MTSQMLLMSFYVRFKLRSHLLPKIFPVEQAVAEETVLVCVEWSQRSSSRVRERPFLGLFSRCLPDEKDSLLSWPSATPLAGLQ